VNEDPKRLLSEHGESNARERELLASVRRVAPPAGAKDEAWRAITVQLAAGAAATAASTASTASAKAGAGSLLPGAFVSKAVLTVAAGSLAIGGYLAAQHVLAPAPPTPAPSRPQPALSATVPPQPAHQTQPAPALPPAPALAPAGPPTLQRPPNSARPDLLAAESAALTKARAQLRAGDLRAAQATLRRLQARVPRGELDQEREVLAIEVLSAKGNLSAARRRARAFVSAHPRSPHSDTLTRFLDPP
jgi:hypothetical protein